MKEFEHSPAIICADAERRAAALADFDSDVASRAAFADDDAERWAHAPDDPLLWLRKFNDAVEPHLPAPKPREGQGRVGRRLAWRDFCFKRGVLMLTLIYDGKEGRQRVTQEKAVELWLALWPAPAPGRKRMTEDTLQTIWKKRDSDHNPHAWSTREKSKGDPPYMTRADLLKMLVDMIRDDEQRLEARRAKAHAESPGG